VNGSIGKPILVVAAAVAIVSIIAGIIVIGSPSQGRFERLDSGRIVDLKGIMGATDLFWSRNERLPASLEELAEDARTSVNRIDPGSGEAYGYEILSEDSYQVCATFDRESVELPGRSANDFWRHGAGRQCFQLEVDKSLPKVGSST